MTRDSIRKRIAALEEYSSYQRGPIEVRHLRFINADGGEVDATLAQGPYGFVCRRESGEELDAFKSRATDEVIAAKPRGLSGYRLSRLRLAVGSRTNPTSTRGSPRLRQSAIPSPRKCISAKSNDWPKRTSR